MESVARASRAQVSLAFFGISSGLFFLIVPVSLAVRFGTANALIGTALAVVYSSVVAGGMAFYAARTGQTANDLSTQLFGRSGGALPTAVLCLTGCWYAVFEGSILAVAAAKVLGISYEAAAVVVALYTTPLGMGSVQHVLDRLNGFLLPFTLAGVAALVGATGARVGFSDAWLHLGPPEPRVGAWWESFAAFGSCALLGPIAMDFANAGRPEDAPFLALVPFGVPFFAPTLLLNGAVGIFLVGSLPSLATSETAVIDASIDVLTPYVALAYIFVSQTRINSSNMYIATLNLHSLLVLARRRGCFPRVWARLALSDSQLKVAAGAAVGVSLLTVMLLSDVFATLGTLLLVQGVLMAAWMGVAAVHVVRWAVALQAPFPRPAELEATCASQDESRRVASVDAEAMPEWQWVGTTAMVCGVVVGFALLFGSDGGSTSFAATFSPLVTMALSAAAAAAFPTLAARLERWGRHSGAVELRDAEALQVADECETPGASAA